mmetsp:Transcript_34608/g.86106  ORF Transcript_34608/g.86106 Transcript_34608/m.86106 type:complete len:85 (-) Transcript_34608:326-580(-)
MLSSAVVAAGKELMKEAILSAVHYAQHTLLHRDFEPSKQQLLYDAYADSSWTAWTQAALVCAVFLVLALLAKRSRHNENATLLL